MVLAQPKNLSELLTLAKGHDALFGKSKENDDLVHSLMYCEKEDHFKIIYRMIDIGSFRTVINRIYTKDFSYNVEQIGEIESMDPTYFLGKNETKVVINVDEDPGFMKAYIYKRGSSQPLFKFQCGYNLSAFLLIELKQDWNKNLSRVYNLLLQIIH